MFKLGDKVHWASQGAGKKVLKVGEVIEVVPAGEKPNLMPAKRIGDKTRPEESYVVRATVEGKNKVNKYWPLTKKLAKVEEFKGSNTGCPIADSIFTF